jgi:hypothetical protein
MSPNEWVALAVGGCALLTSLLMALRWVIKSYLTELKPNSGSSLYDAISRIDEKSTRLEKRVDDLYSLIVKRQL